MRNKIAGTVAVLLIGGVGWWALHTYLDHSFRKSTTGALAEISLDFISHQAERAKFVDEISKASRIGTPEWDPESESEKKFGVEWRALDEKYQQLIRRFLALEQRVKERYGGELPAWVKDDRNWQALDDRVKRK